MQRVSWRRGNRPILNNIHWNVERGEHWAIIGPNGAGKTALLNMISGYVWPTTGKVAIFNRVLGQVDVRELRKSIGWVSSALFERLYRIRRNERVLNVVLSGKFASLGIYEQVSAADENSAQELLELFQCAHLAEKPFHVLSQGEKQRILLARAWMSRPKLLILDEPCTGLDLLARERLLSAIQRLAEAPDGPTILYVSHHVEEIIPLFTHALLLKDGHVLAGGKKRDVLQKNQLSELFGVNLNVTWQAGRPWIQSLSPSMV